MENKGKVVYSFEEVSKHNTSNDCWLIISGKVYDVTKFMDNHPGGDEVLVSATGKDATVDFEEVDHSSTANAMMDEYYLGEIDAATIPSNVSYTSRKKSYFNKDKIPGSMIKLLQFLVSLAIIGLSVAVSFYTKSSD